MQQKLYANIKRMTGIFCACIILITATALVSRLTFLSGLAVTSSSSGVVEGGADVNDSGADYSINSKIYFPAPDARGNVLITNKESNENYIRVDIRLNASGRSVYYSGDIAPGTPINSARLQGAAMEEGVYECTAIITAYDPITKDKVGEEQIAVAIYIGVKP
jgi:hypothetical protein